MNLCVISACYHEPERAAILAESCGRFGVPLLFCAAREWEGRWRVEKDLRTGKLVAALETILDHRRAYDHFLWADGFDTFLQAGALSIEGRWNMLRCPPLVFSAEKNCYPHANLASEYPESPTPFRYLNSGAWLGQTGYLIDVIRGILERSEGSSETSDQGLWTRAFLTEALPGAVLDYECRLFQSMWQTDDPDPRAPVVHYNGEASWGKSTRYQEHWARVKAGVPCHG